MPSVPGSNAGSALGSSSAAAGESAAGGAGLVPLGCPTLEALDAATGVHQLLLAGVEGVACRAEFHMEIRLGRPGVELVATRTMDVGNRVLGVYFSLHILHPRATVIAEAGRFRPEKHGSGVLAGTPGR